MVRALALLGVGALTLAAARPDRGWSFRQDTEDDAAPADAGIAYLFAYDAPTGDCDGADAGTSVTFSRASAATCQKNDNTIISLAANTPRTSSRGFYRESSGVNLILHSRDLSQSAWTKTNATCTKTATGTDTVTNSASTCTATSANATIAQTVTAAAAARSTSVFLKRRTGTGTIEVSRDNGSTYTDVTACVDSGTNCTLSYGGYRRPRPQTHGTLTSSVLNPTVVIRLATSGDAVDIDRVQDEAGTQATSPIDTGGTSVTRSADVAKIPKSGLSESEGCAFIELEPIWTGAAAATARVVEGRADNTARIFNISSAADSIGIYNGTTFVNVAATYTAWAPISYRSSWSVTGNQSRIRNNSTLVESTGVFSAFATIESTLGLGSRTSDGALGPAVYIKRLRLNDSATGCE